MKAKKILSVIIALAMIIGTMGITASANADLTISNLEELQNFANAVNDGNAYEGETVVLGATIDISSVADWTPIGNGSRSGAGYSGNAFKGTFDGQGNTISGLTIASGENAGLFGVVDGGTVKNVKLTSVNINATAGDNVGAAVAVLLNGGTVDGIEVFGTVSGLAGVGGVVGRVLAEGTVSNCTNAAVVTQTGKNDAAGGIVGKAYYTVAEKEMTISNCKNTGAITSDYSAGGIVGLSAANVMNCTNTANIAAGLEAGGIVGEQVNYGEVSGNKNTGAISSIENTPIAYGGIIGWVRYQNNSTNYANNEVITVSGNTNEGSVIASTAGLGVGGIVGTVYNQVTVTDNSNTAESIASATFASGIVGAIQESEDNLQIEGADYTISNNFSTTPLEKITANCIALYVYDNFSGTNDSVIIEENNDTWVAAIGTKKYVTFDEAIKAANAMTGEVTVEIYGKVEYTNATANLTGAYTAINFVGKTDDAEISITRNGSNGYIKANNQTVNFEDLILSKPEGAFANDAGFMNVYFTVYTAYAVNYTNCTFPDGACASGCPVSYTGCDFANQTSGEYSLWVYGNATATVNNCEFTGVRGVKMFAEGKAKTANLVLQNTTFADSVTQKPAIVLTYGASVTLENNEYPEKGVFELDADGDPDGTTVTADITDIACKNDALPDCGVLVDGKIYSTIETAKEAVTAESTVVVMYSTDAEVELPAGANLVVTEGNTAPNVTVTEGNVISALSVDAVAGEETATMRFITEATEIGGEVSAYGTYIIPVRIFDDWSAVVTFGSYDAEENAIAEGDTYAVDLAGIPADYYDDAILARSFMIVDGNTVYCTFSAASVNEVK